MVSYGGRGVSRPNIQHLNRVIRFLSENPDKWFLRSDIADYMHNKNPTPLLTFLVRLNLVKSSYGNVNTGKYKNCSAKLFKLNKKKYFDLMDFSEDGVDSVPEKLVEFENRDKLLDVLEKLKDEDIDRLSSIISLNKIDDILEIWQENMNNPSEGFWQNLFKKENWVLSQIFACPYFFIGGMPFAGGKNIQGRGGVYSDFLMKQSNSNNIAFIEIKTPSTDIMNSFSYRGKVEDASNIVYSNHSEFSGAINQVLNQKRIFLRQRASNPDESRDYENPKCIVVIGNRKNLTNGQTRSFDLFRASCSNVEIITFDEIFERISLLKKVFLE